MTGQVHCIEAAGFDHADLQSAAPFDLIFANILKGPLIALAPDLVGSLKPGGYAILSGILNEQADGVIDVYLRLGTNLVSRDEIGEWTTLLLAKTA
jgi:ribosomal protein L11 methyltransferase